MKRRRFVATPLFLAGTLTGDGAFGVATAMAATPVAAPELIRVPATAFGTTICLSALAGPADPDGRATRAALHRAMQEVQHIDALLSLFHPDSQLSVLNRTGALDGAHPHLLRNLEFGLQLGAQTHGAFDVTVQPLWETFARCREQGHLPSQSALAQARQLVDYRAVRIDDDRIRIQRPGARVTLNSVAQGYAVDVVLQILRAHGVPAALIDTGEIGNLGGRDGGLAGAAPWRVGVQHPRRRDAFIAQVAMDGRVLSTSGDYATRFTADFRHHHIFDPQRGDSPTTYASTIVLATSGLVADGLSTALMVLDHDAGCALLRAYPGSDALWIDKRARLRASAGVPFIA